jgi:hypothetical protein
MRCKSLTNSGGNWDAYQQSSTVRKTIDIYLAKLNEFINANNKAERKQRNKERQQHGDNEISQETIHRHRTSVKKYKPKKQTESTSQPTMVERIPEELRFIKRFVNLNGKTKTKDEILRFINSLQKSMVEKRIKKTSAYAEQIRYIQEKLIDVYNNMKTKIKLELKPETYDSLKTLTEGEKQMTSISFIKRYISITKDPDRNKKEPGKD